MPLHCVVGSGPAGVACAQALLEKGLTVRLLDAGLTLEESRARVVAQLAATAPSAWDPKLVAVLKENMTAGAKGLPDKLVYGSDFPYRDAEKLVRWSGDGVGLKPSLALGGLSNVWGAAMMPYTQSDVRDWPIDFAKLAEHYPAVAKMASMAGRTDGLAEKFPLHSPNPAALEPSSQARGLLESMDRNQAALKSAGIIHGASRVAIRAKHNPADAGCVYCGLCMYGCPYGYIYNSASTLAELQRDPNFSYQPDTIVTGLAENGGNVTIRSRHRITGEANETEADRVYLAAGVIPTTKLLLESRELFDQTVWMRDSQYFLMPLLTKRARNVRAESLHTLSQLFVEISDADLSAHTVHLQIYSYSDLIGQALRQSLGKFGLNFEFVARQLEERLMIAQGFLHSDESSKIAVTLRRADGGARLELCAEINPAARGHVKRVMGKLSRHKRDLGAMPIASMSQVAEPGRSYHSGGTFPMRRQPGPFESDTLGRPHGWQRVHAVDATVFPSIPATTITMSVMANARRIAIESASLS